MSAYAASGAPVLGALAAVFIALLLAGFVLARARPGAAPRALAWLLLPGAVAAVDHLCAREAPGLRMVALIAAGLLAMKAIVATSERVRGLPPLPLPRWLEFALGWPGMQPRLFVRPRAGALSGGGALLARGAVRVTVGAAL